MHVGIQGCLLWESFLTHFTNKRSEEDEKAFAADVVHLLVP